MRKQSNLSRLTEYAGGHRFLTYSSWILSAVSALIALVPFWYIWRILDEVIEVAPNFSRAENLIYYGWMAVLFAVISMLTYIAALMCSHIAAFRVASNLRRITMRHIVTLPLGVAEGFGSGKLRKIVNESSAATETYLAHQLPDKAGAIATPCGLLVLLFVFDWRLGFLSLIPVVLGFLIMMAMTGAGMREKMKEYQNALDSMSNEAVEYVRGIPVVKTFGQTVFSFKRFKASIDNYGKWVIAYTKQLRGPMMCYTAAINGVFVFLIAGALIFTANGVTGEFLLNLLFYIIITPVISLTLTKIMFMSENGMIVADALERIDSVLTLDSLSEPVNPKMPKDSSIELSHVCFSYDFEKNNSISSELNRNFPSSEGVTSETSLSSSGVSQIETGKDKENISSSQTENEEEISAVIDGDVIKDVSLRIEPGQTVAFVGPSGGGKSTLASLISRFFDARSGSVKIGGVNVKDIRKEDLMNTVSFVFQNSRLIKASILDNVRLGKPSASENEVMRALKAAQCLDIIEKFPLGVNTVIGTKGVYLSGGEQQRIAIARAILKNTPIIIMDEATAFADPDNETRVQAAMSELAKGKTVVMIAHRLSTVADADCIYVLDNGRIAEFGTRDALYQKGGLFSKMWDDYQASVRWKVEREG